MTVWFRRSSTCDQPMMSPSSPADQTLTAEVKAAVQDLLRVGVVYETSKPKVYRRLVAHRSKLAAILDPLDLVAQFDEVRGLVFVAVAATSPEDHEPAAPTAVVHEPIGQPEIVGPDEAWHHPLVRRQRLTLEQSLLLAILRRHYTEHEQSVGVGAMEPTVSIDDLLPDLQIYLGSLGSESAEDKRIRDLLDQLHRHSIVSSLDDDQVTIRPLICHVANPSTLSTLLEHYRSLAPSEPVDNPAEPPAETATIP